MRYAYGVLVLSSLVWQKDLPGNDRAPGKGREGLAGASQEGGALQQLHTTFCSFPSLYWVPESPWGLRLAGMAMLVLWLVVEIWASSCLTTLLARPRQTTVRLPQTDPEAQSRADFQTEQAKQSLCICGKEVTSGIESYEQPCEMHKHSSLAYQDMGNGHQDGILYPEYNRSRSSFLCSNVILCNISSSSSSSSFCLSHLKHLDLHSSSRKIPITARDSSSTTSDSSDESESKSYNSSSKSDDPSSKKGKREPSYVPSVKRKRKPSYILSVKRKCEPSYVPSMKRKCEPADILLVEEEPEPSNILLMEEEPEPADILFVEEEPESSDILLTKEKPEPSDIPLTKEKPKDSYILMLPESCLEVKSAPDSPGGDKPQPLTSFAKINIRERSAYEKDDHIVLVEKSLEIQMGPVPLQESAPPPAPAPPPKAMLTDPGERKERATQWLRSGKMDPLRIDRNLMGKLGLRGIRERSVEASPQIRPHLRSKVTVRSTSPFRGFEPVPFVLKKMDDGNRSFLEFHVKKKMVQRQCGIPTLVDMSRRWFQSLENQQHLVPVSSHERPKGNITWRPMKAGRAARLDSPPGKAIALYATPLETPLRTKEFYVLHPVELTKTQRILASPPPAMKKPGTKRDVRENSVLLSMELGEIRRLLFHHTVKMLEIRKGAFPEVVENSFRVFSALSACPLPKPIHFGIKVPRPKHLTLPFIAREALCILDLNVRHKDLICSWKLETPYMTSAAEMTVGSSQPSGLKAGLDRGGAHKPTLSLKKRPKGKASPPGRGQGLTEPEPQQPRGSPSPPVAGAGKSPKVHFPNASSDEPPAHSVFPEHKATPQEPTLWSAPASPATDALQLGTQPPGTGDLEMQPEEGVSAGALLLPSSDQGAAADGKGDGSEEAGQRDSGPPPTLEKGEEAGGGSPREGTMPAGQVELGAPSCDTILPLSIETGEATDRRTEAANARSVQEEVARGLQNSALPAPWSAENREEEVDGERAGPRKARAWQNEAAITRTSLFLELDLTKEKLNVHLKETFEAKLRLPQAVELKLDVGVGKEAGGGGGSSSRKAKKAARRHGPPAPRPQGRPSRPFCYICMPLDETSSAFKTVCWTLPKAIMAMNGNRIPQVVRLDSKPEGLGPAAQA